MNKDANYFFEEARKYFHAGDSKEYKFLRKASALGHREATDYLASAYWHGEGVKKSRRKYFRYIRRLEEMGDVDAAHSMWLYYYKNKYLIGRWSRLLKYIKIVADSEPDKEHFGLIRSANKMMATLFSKGEESAAYYQSQYDTMKDFNEQGEPVS